MRKFAIFFEDKDGMFAVGYKNKTDAIKALQELWDEDLEQKKQEMGDIKFTEETVKEDVVYEHKICNYYTLDENICGECGESTTGHGQLSYSINF